MRTYKTLGYDDLTLTSVAEITEMYIKEGVPVEEAKERAKIIHKEIDRLNHQEMRLWERVRKHEVLIADLHPAKQDVITGYDGSDDEFFGKFEE